MVANGSYKERPDLRDSVRIAHEIYKSRAGVQMREDSSFPSFFRSINAKYLAFFLGKTYLSISRAALILLAFLSPSRMGTLLILKAGK
jgi:hypothetical protein